MALSPQVIPSPFWFSAAAAGSSALDTAHESPAVLYEPLSEEGDRRLSRW